MQQVSRFVFEFNEGEKVSHLGQAYTWYGVNGVQYDVSRISRRVPLGSVEEWVIVNQRLGRGEGAKGCPPPSGSSIENATTNVKPNAGDSGTDRRSGAVGSGDSRGRRTRRVLESLQGGEGEGATGVELKESTKACDRAGPGKVTSDTHPFHLHVHHFQVRRGGCNGCFYNLLLGGGVIIVGCMLLCVRVWCYLLRICFSRTQCLFCRMLR